METVSILMAAYNAEKTIGAAVSSVLAQTWKDWALIVVDDGSSDRTPAILEELQRSDDRIRLYRNEVNSGVSVTRYRALQEARGEWVAILDSDDMWKPDKLEKQMALQKRTGGDVFFTGSGFMTADGTPIDWYFPAPETVDYKTLLRQNVMSNSSVLVRRQLYAENYSHGDEMHEDFAVWLRLLRSGRIAYGINEPLLIYRLSDSSKTGDKRRAARMNWNTYRYVGLGWLPAVYYMSWYTVNGLKKHASLRRARLRAEGGHG